MATLREQYEAMSVDALEKMLVEASLATEARNLCKLVINEKSGKIVYPVSSLPKPTPPPGLSKGSESPAVNSRYKVSRVVISLAALVGWVSLTMGGILLVGAVGMLISAGGDMVARMSGGSAAAGGFGLIISGLLLVMFSQLTRATLDSADYARETLFLAKQQADRAAS